jgi:predicted NBD/HSP70 family sugar kinase
MGGHDIKFGATNLKADELLLPELIKCPSLTSEGPSKSVVQMVAGIEVVLKELDAQWSDVADVSVTVPCPCTPAGTIIEATNLGSADTKEMWKLPFGDLLYSAIIETSGLEIPVFCCNDANAAGQDDDFVRFGSSKKLRTSVFVTTGTGLGGSTLINGQVITGLGQAGELGHVKPAIPVQYQARFANDTNPLCGCTGHQCTETMASLKGMIGRIEWALSDEGIALISKDLEARGEQVDQDVLAKLRGLCKESPSKAAYEVRTYADEGKDALSRWLLEDWAIMIGVLFANLAPVLHPTLYIIGGGMTEMSDQGKEWFIDVTRRVYDEVNGQACFKSEPGNCEIVWSVSQDQGWRGSILMAIRARQGIA